MQNYIEGTNRHQSYFSTLEAQVSADNAVRLMDAFINKLDLEKLGFTKTVHRSEGRPPYAAQILLKLYLYGYLNKIRSSRKLEKECSRNIELQWLLQNLAPFFSAMSPERLRYVYLFLLRNVPYGRHCCEGKHPDSYRDQRIIPMMACYFLDATNSGRNIFFNLAIAASLHLQANKSWLLLLIHL